MSTTSTASKRIEALDYLRGFFILIIIVDHLWRWPNLFQYVSGRGELWVSAAEGFVIISGLLVGYIHGRKGLKKPFGEVATKLILRGALLYLWTVITAFLFVAASWYLTYRSNIAFIPYGNGDWMTVILDTLTLHYAHQLTHFLYLYAIFLVISPVVIWLLRQGLWWVTASVSTAAWLIGTILGIEWLQWQILFFVPATTGYYLDQMIAYSRRIPYAVTTTAMLITLSSIVVSAIIILPHDPGSYARAVFSKEPMALARILLAFLWFVALAWLFNKLLPLLEKCVGWLLLPFGTRSLTAYIVHGFILMAIALLFPPSTSWLLNSLYVCIAVLGTWALVRSPAINRYIPR